MHWLLVASAIGLLASCGSDHQGAATRWELESHAGSPSRAKEPSAFVRGKIGPGTFVSTRFAPEVSFTLRDPWIGSSERSTELDLAGVERNDNVQIVIIRRSAIRVAVDPTETKPPTGVRRKTRVMDAGPLDEVRSIPDVVVTTGPKVKVDGLLRQTHRVRSTVRGLPSDDCGTARCRLLPTASGGSAVWSLGPGEESTVIDLPDEDPWIIVGETTTDSSHALEDASAILGSLLVRPS